MGFTPVGRKNLYYIGFAPANRRKALHVGRKFSSLIMNVELIPVLEIGYNNQGLPSPSEHPYWEYPDIWEKYNADCYEKAGFKDKMTSYFPGSSFYRLSEFSNNNLLKLINDHTEDFRLGDYNSQKPCPLFGGYVLRIDGENKYFPQCCGDLSDIKYWQILETGKKSPYHGHPEPLVTFKKDTITFDFTVYDFDEPFAPAPANDKLSFPFSLLKEALDHAKYELDLFSIRIKKLNQSEAWNIPDIDKLLIWGEDWYKQTYAQHGLYASRA